ncbi:MAG: hypothetical protein FWG99_08155 [Treponema sp.]|nr:hypothetical protein [Treponema sp.]
MKKAIITAVFFLVIPVLSFPQDMEQVVTMLYEKDITRVKFEEKIIFIKNFNFGIPGGVNWLVGWHGYLENNRSYNTSMVIYIVDVIEREIIFSRQISVSDDILQYVISWQKSLPGISIDVCQVGDFNDNGFDDILQFRDGIPEPRFEIHGYNPLSNGIERFCSIPYLLTRQDDQPPPVEFITYKRMKGFKVLYPTNRWFFYTWNEDRREYVEVEEVNPAYIEETYVNTGEWRNIQPTFPSVLAAPEPEAVVDNSATEITENSDEPNNQQTPFWVWVAIGGGLLLIICVVVIIKRKK